MHYDGNYDEDSDLTELDDEDEEDEPISRPSPPSTSNFRASTRPTTKASTAKRQNADKITPRLKKPAITPYPIVHIRYLLTAGRIDLNAEYQRDVVWNEHKQVQLIDSLMHNYYMPPLVFSVISNEDDTETHVCIDGKQRLTAIQKFLDGQIPHKDHLTHRKLWYSNTGSQKRAVLSQAERDRFDGTLINCVEYGSLSDDDEREIFQRVQLGVALSPAERMLAINGPNAALVRAVRLKLAEYDYKLDRAKGDGKSAATRGRDFQTIAQVLYLINRHISKLKLLEPNSTRVEVLLNDTTPVSPAVQTALEGAMNTLCLLVLDPVLGKSLSNGRHKLSPVEFVMTGFLLFLYRLTLSLTQLSDAVEKMRKNVRHAHRDVRFNSVVYKHLLDFVLSVKDMKLKGDGGGDVPAARLRMMGIADSVPAPSAKMGTASASVKRKRADRDDDEVPSNQTKRVKAMAPPASSSKKTAPTPSTSKPIPKIPSKKTPIKEAKPQPKSKPTPSPLFTPSSTPSVSPASAKHKHGTRSNDEAEEVIQPRKARVQGRPSAKRMRVESPEPEVSEGNDAEDKSGRENGGEEDGVVVRGSPPKRPKTPASRASVKLNTGKEKDGKEREKEKEGTREKEKESAGKTRVKRSSAGSASTAAQASTSKSVVKPTKPVASASAPTLKVPPAPSNSESAIPLPTANTSVPPSVSSPKIPCTKAPCQTAAASSGMGPETKKAPTSNTVMSTPNTAPPPIPSRPNSRAQTQSQATSASSTPVPAPPVPARVPSTLSSSAFVVHTNDSAAPSQTQPFSVTGLPSQFQQSRSPSISTPTSSSVPVAKHIKSERASPPSTQLIPSAPASVSNPPQQTPNPQLSSDSPESRTSSTSRLAPYYAAKELVQQRAQQAQQEEAQRVQQEQQAQEEQARRAQAQRAQQWAQQQAQQQQVEQERVQRTQQQANREQAPRAEQQQQRQVHDLPARPVFAQVTTDPRVRIGKQDLQPQSQQQPQSRRRRRRREREPQQQHWDPWQYGKDPELVLHEQLDNIHNSLQPQPTTRGNPVPSIRQAAPAGITSYPPSIGRSFSNSRTQGQGMAPLRVDAAGVDPQPSMSPLTPVGSPVVSHAVTNSHPISSSDQSYVQFSNDWTVTNPSANVHTNLARQVPSQPRGMSMRSTPLSPSSSASYDAAPEKRMSMDSMYSQGSNHDFSTRDRVNSQGQNNRERDPWTYRENPQTEWSGDEHCYRPMANRGGRGPMNS